MTCHLTGMWGEWTWTRLVSIARLLGETDEKENKVWEQEGLNALSAGKCDRSHFITHLKFAIRQEHEPEQTLFPGKGWAGHARSASELSWRCGSLWSQNHSARSDCTLSPPLGPSCASRWVTGDCSQSRATPSHPAFNTVGWASFVPTDKPPMRSHWETTR